MRPLDLAASAHSGAMASVTTTELATIAASAMLNAGFFVVLSSPSASFLAAAAGQNTAGRTDATRAARGLDARECVEHMHV